MNVRTTIFVLVLAAPAAWAQASPAPINAARNAAAVASSNTQRTNAAMPNAPAAPATTAAPNAKAATANAPASKPGTKKHSAPIAEAVKKELEKPQPENKPTQLPRQSRRDPFMSIIRTDAAGTKNPCVSGKKCLAVNEIVLRGIVRSQGSVIAVVENPEKKTYFLRENDPVLNGEVVKITADSVVFRERSTDRAGRVNTKEITKKIDARPIA